MIDKLGLGGEVTRLLNSGLVASQIATQLGVSPETVLGWIGERDALGLRLLANQMQLMERANATRKPKP